MRLRGREHEIRVFAVYAIQDRVGDGTYGIVHRYEYDDLVAMSDEMGVYTEEIGVNQQIQAIKRNVLGSHFRTVE